MATTPEAEEAVAELLVRVVGQASVITRNRETGASQVAVYLEDRAFWTTARRAAVRDGLAAIRRCGLDVAPGRVSWRKVAPEDWRESWKRHFRPLDIGGRLLVRPSWSRRRPVRGQVEVVLDPGLSFGTGQHPTTEFCLRELVRRRSAGAPVSLLDVGTGSGILALAAARLGYRPVEAFDFDPEAVRVARENAALNGLARDVRIVRRDVATLGPSPRRRYDVVCANLTADLLRRHANRLVGQLVPGGRLVLSGILAAEFDPVRARFESLGLACVRARTEREWRSATFRESGC